MRKILLCILSIGVSVNCFAFGKSETKRLEDQSQWMKKTLLEMNQEFSDLYFEDQTPGTPVPFLPVKLQILDHYGILGRVGPYSLTTLTQKYNRALDETQADLKMLKTTDQIMPFENRLLFGQALDKKKLDARIRKNKMDLEELRESLREFKKRAQSPAIKNEAKLYREILNDPKAFLSGNPRKLISKKPGIFSRLWSKLTRKKDYAPFTNLATAPELLAQDLLFIDAVVKENDADLNSEVDLQKKRVARADGLWWFLNVRDAMKQRPSVEEVKKKPSFRGLSKIDYRRMGKGLGQMGCAAGMAVVAVGVSGLVGSTGFKPKERYKNTMLALNSAIPFAVIGAKNIRSSIYSEDELDSSVNLNESLKTTLGDYAASQADAQVIPGKSSQMAH